MIGGSVCASHGGKAPQVKRAATARRARRVASRLAIDLEADQNPPAVLLAELRRACALADFFGDRLARGEAHLGAYTKLGPQMTVETELWQRERDRAITLSIACLKLGLEERRVRLTEAAGRDLATMVRNIAKDLGVGDHPQLLQVVQRRLSEMRTIELDGSSGEAGLAA